MYGEVYAAWHFDGKHFDADGRGRRKIALKQVDVHTRHAISLTHTYSPTLTPADGLRSQREVSSNEVVQRNSIFCSAVAAQAAACCSLSISTAGRDAFLPAVCLLDLRRVYEAPFLERAGRLPLGQTSKREQAVTGYPRLRVPGTRVK